VIGVPVGVSLGGLDALLATVQMPSGIPVATVAIGGADNAAILAAQILGVRDAAIQQRLEKFKAELAEGVKQKNLRLQKKVDSGHAG
jgi:5-(carboxyamino)imidazole ribonucleotide mutase